MASAKENLVRDTLRLLANGEITPKEAAGIFVANRVKALSTYFGEFSAPEVESLHELMPALDWEFLKHDLPGVPDVDFGSPAQRAWDGLDSHEA